jgi:hypothetical protein
MPESPGEEDVVPIKGDSGYAPAGADRPFVSNDPGDLSGYEALSYAVNELLPWSWWTPPPVPPGLLDVNDDIVDVVPIAGDTSGPEDDVASFGTDGSYVGSDPTPPSPSPAPAGPSPAPTAPSPGVDYGDLDDLIDDLLDAIGAAPEPDEGLLPPPRTRPRNPWLVAAIVAAAVLIAGAVLAFTLGGSSSSHSAASDTSTTTPPSTTLAASTTTAAPVGPSDVTMSLGLGEVNGRTLPLQVTLQANPGAPHTMSVKVAFAGPGIQPSDTFQLVGTSPVTHTVVANGCGSWTMQVVSINEKPIAAKGNPNLQNGATHNC